MSQQPPQYLPPPPLTMRPDGLLDFLGIQTGGKYPQRLAPDLIPVLQLAEWYREAQAVTVQGTAAGVTSANSFVSLITVPAGEAWLVGQLDMFSTAAIPATVTKFNAAIATSIITATVREVIAPPLPASLVGATTVYFRNFWAPPNTLLLQPGVSVGAWCQELAGTGGPTLNINIRCARLTL